MSRQLFFSASKRSSPKESGIPAKEIVLALMEKEGPAYSKAVGKDNTVHEFQDYKCPKERCKSVISLRIGSGYTNAFSHLIKCYQSEEKLMAHFCAARAKATENGGSIRDHFEANTLNSRENSFVKWTNLIVKKNVPPSMIEDPVFRNALDVDALTIKTWKEMLFQLVILVEQVISKEMLASTSGGLMHDGWTCNGVHYLGLFGCYNVKRAEVQQSKKILKDYPVTTLLSVAPLAVVEEEQGQDFVNVDVDGKAVHIAKEKGAEARAMRACELQEEDISLN